MASRTERGALRRALLITLGAVVLLIAVALSLGEADDDAETQPSYQVRRGPMTIAVSESGTVKPRKQIVISNQVQGQTTIINLVDEGTRVEEGDLLVELDASRLEDERVDQQIRVQNAEAAFVRARENLAVTRSQAESAVAQAELDYRFAQEDLSKYTEGEYPNQRKQAQSTISLANEELERAQEKLQWSEVLNEERYISASELQADRLSANRAALELELAQNDLDLLERYTHPRRMAELESAIEQTYMALERERRKATGDIVQAEAELTAKESELRRQKDKLAKLEEQIAKTTITAPASGLVVYATSANASWRGNADPLEEGQTVRERQDLIHLPTDAGMKAETSVHEAQLGLVRPGMPVRITVDALPGKSFSGTVDSIAPLPDAARMWMNPDLKVYPTQILIDGSDSALRTGMSCRVEIISAVYQDALQIPIQAAQRHEGQSFVYVRGAQGWQARAVTLGLDDGSMAHVIDGLQVDDEVLLTPPLGEPEGLELPDPANAEAAASKTTAADPVPQAAETPTHEPPATTDEEPSGDADERRRAMRERLQNMSPEERAKLREQWRQRRQQRDGGER